MLWRVEMSMLGIASCALVCVSVLGIPSESRAQTSARKSAGTESVIQFRFADDSPDQASA